MSISAELLEQHQVLVSTDNPFQQRARLLQALWREERELPMGVRRGGVPLGSRLPLDFGRESRANFMSPAAQKAVELELEGKRAGSGQLIEEDRLFANLLSSQPLCFNLFAELQSDLGLATRVLLRLWPAKVGTVTAVRFEHSPGRAEARFTGDHSAFDVFFEHSTPEGGRGFIGVEVKYHENLKVKAAKHRPRYDEVARAMGCFKAESLPALREAPLEQIWRDHLLAGSMLLAAEGWDSGLYLFLYPEQNAPCRIAVDRYREHLTDTSGFDSVTLEQVVGAIEAETEASWIGEVRKRYLGWERTEKLLLKAQSPAPEADAGPP